MNILLDTQLLLWWQTEPERLPQWIIDEIQGSTDAPVFSVVSIWEVVIKSALSRSDFNQDAALMRTTFMHHGWEELGLTGPHVLAVASLKLHHGDPFDRVLVAQAKIEKRHFVTTDKALAKYGNWVEVVKSRKSTR